MLTPQNSYVVPVVSVGTKTDTPVMNTPLNVQAVTQKLIEDQQAVTVEEAVRDVSGVFATSGAAAGATGVMPNGGISIRGFLTQDTYRNGFRNYGRSVVDTDTANVAMIEVLKGPAAILYGISEPGGIVNIVTKEPQATARHSVTQQIGSLALYRTTVSTTGPLDSDRSLLFRVDASYTDNGAPFGPFVDLTHARSVFVAPVVKWIPSESTWVKAELDFGNSVTSSRSPRVPLYRGAFLPIPRNINYGEDSPFHVQSIFTALSLSHNFNSDWSIKSRFAYTDNGVSAKLLLPQSLAAGANPLITRIGIENDSGTATLTTNLDVVGHLDLLFTRNTILLGGDFYRTFSSVNLLPQPPWDGSRISLVAPGHPGIPSFTPAFQQQLIYSRLYTGGLYLQDQIELPYGFHAMAGLRYQNIYQKIENRFLFFLPRVNASVVKPERLHEVAVTPRFGLLWRPFEWVSLYGNYTEGFAPNNNALVYPNDIAPPSSAKSWEAGAKFEFFDGRLRATTDYYELTKTNMTVEDPSNFTCGTSTCSILAGTARSKGVELDIKGEVFPGWNVSVAYANQDVRMVEGRSTGASGTGLNSLRPGDRFPNVPRNLARFSNTYEFLSGELQGLKVGAFYTYNGSQPILDLGGSYRGAPLVASWGTVDLMAGYKFDIYGVNVTAQLNAENILNAHYLRSVGVIGAPTAGFSINGFRAYGAPFAVRGLLRFEL